MRPLSFWDTKQSLLPLCSTKYTPPFLDSKSLKAKLGITNLKNFSKSIPYDYSCPVAQNIMKKRLLSKCGLHLASIKEVYLHEQMHKKQKTAPSDIPSEPICRNCSTSAPKTTTCCSWATKKLLCAFQFQELEQMELDSEKNFIA